VEQENETRGLNGMVVLAVQIAIAAAAAALLASAAAPVGVVLLVIDAIALKGHIINQPNESRVLTLFGNYTGTIRRTGWYWVNPLTAREKVSLRIQTLDSDSLKVNDATGNPIEIAAVITWQVVDTAKAVFSVESYNQFVRIQAEAAVRHVAGEYPYDDDAGHATSLRANADEVMETLRNELQMRLAPAGVDVLETRLRRLAYAPEIAQEMLRRQQATAVVAARRLIVEGAVGMVQEALDMLNDRDVVHLDDAAKAAMVSNLLVVLCSERGSQPVVNAGTS
jgi:regulator of protease activity HflC (stomatin/prohibitin superfamily)